MPLSDGHVLLVEARGLDSTDIAAFDWRGNPLTLTEREQRVLGDHRLPFTIYRGFAYYHHHESDAFIDYYDLNANHHNRAGAFRAAYPVSTKCVIPTIRNDGFLACHLEDERVTEIALNPWEAGQGNPPAPAGAFGRTTSRFTVRSYGLPGHVNQSINAASVLTSSPFFIVPQDWTRRSMELEFGRWHRHERRLFASHSAIYVWINHPNHATLDATLWGVPLKPIILSAGDIGGFAHSRLFEGAVGGEEGRLQRGPTYRGDYEPSSLVADTFAVGDRGFYFIRGTELWSSSGIAARHWLDNTSQKLTGLPQNAKIIATTDHLWMHWHTHQIRRYDLADLSQVRTIDALPVGEQIHDLRAYRHDAVDFIDAPLDQPTPINVEPPAPPAQTIESPASPVTDWPEHEPLVWEFGLDRDFDLFQVRRREVTDPGGSETLGPWLTYDRAWREAVEVSVLLDRDQRGSVPDSWWLPPVDLGDAGSTYDFEFRFHDDATSRWAAWSTTVRVTIGTTVDLPAPRSFWLVGLAAGPDQPLTVMVDLPAGQTATEIWLQRRAHEHDRSIEWYSLADEDWLEIRPQPAATGTYTGIISIELPAGWQPYETTTYWRAQYRTADAQSALSEPLTVVTGPRYYSAAPTLVAPDTQSTLDAALPLEFRGSTAPGLLADQFWLRRRRHGATSWQRWSPSAGWVAGLPDRQRPVDPSWRESSRRADRTEFEFALAAGWQANLERYSYSVAYRGRYGRLSEWSVDVDVTALASDATPGRRAVSVLLDDQGRLQFHDWSGSPDRAAMSRDEQTVFASAVTAYGNHLPDLLHGDELFYLTLTGVDARSLTTGATRTAHTRTAGTIDHHWLVGDPTNTYAYLVERWQVGTVRWARLVRYTLPDFTSRHVINEVSQTQRDDGQVFSDVARTLRRPQLIVGDDDAYLARRRVRLDGSDTHLLAGQFISMHWHIEEWSSDPTRNSHQQSLGISGDHLYLLNRETSGAPPLDVLRDVIGTGSLGGADVWREDVVADQQMDRGIIVATPWHIWVRGRDGGSGGTNDGAVYRYPVGDDGIDDTPAYSISPYIGSGTQVQSFGVYWPRGWEWIDRQRSTTITAAIRWLRRGPLRRDPDEPLALEFRNGFVSWWRIALRRRERGGSDDDWVYWQADGGWGAREEMLAAQPAGTVDTYEDGNAYLLPAGWGDTGIEYEFSVRYATSSASISAYSDALIVQAVDRPVSGLLEPPTITRPLAGATVDGERAYQFVIRIPDDFDALFVRLRRRVEGGSTFESWQAAYDGAIPLDAGWRTDGGWAWHQQRGTSQREIAIPLPAGWQDHGTTYLYQAQYSATRERGNGRTSSWSPEYPVGSVDGASDLAANLYDEYPLDTPEAPTWVTRSGGYDPTGEVTFAWRYHPRLLGQTQERHEVIRWPADDPASVEYYSGDNDWSSSRTWSVEADTEITMPAGWQPTGTTYHYAVRARAAAGDWSALSGALVVAAGPAVVTLTTPVAGQTVGQTVRLDWQATDQVAYQVAARRPGTPQAVIYDSGWQLSSERHANVVIPASISSGTTDVQVRVRDKWARESDWAVAAGCVISYTPAGPSLISVTASVGDDRVRLRAQFPPGDNPLTYDIERWSHITSPPDLVARLDAAGIDDDERERIYSIVDGATAPTGSQFRTVEHRDYTARSGVPYAYRIISHYDGERTSASRWTSIIVS